jgi:hypothetical protein
MIRDLFHTRLHRDLVGPGSDDEIIGDRPGDRYLTGILFPPRTALGADQDDDADTAGDAEEGGVGAEAVAGANMMRPSTAGLSFALRTPAGSPPAVTIRITSARYLGVDIDDERSRAPASWRRHPVAAMLEEMILNEDGDEEIDLGAYGAVGLRLYVRTSRWVDVVLVTAAVSNATELPGRPGRRDLEEATFFQFAMEIRAACDSRLHPRPIGGGRDDEDSRTAALIYRNTTEYAVGHVCSASWPRSSEVDHIATRWIPDAVVRNMSARGDRAFIPVTGDPDREDAEKPKLRPLSARWLAACSDEEMREGLTLLVDCYSAWIESQAARTLDGGDLAAVFHPQAKANLERCTEALKRVRAGRDLLASDSDVRAAFRNANLAMDAQRGWSNDEPLTWFPFQLAFALLCLESIARPDCDDREVMDLLWFPTGGGKTEAYLLLTAFTIFLRRLRGEAPSTTGGVTVFMRYTLRLLTIQQFQRAAALICACELLRIGRLKGAPSTPDPRLRASPPISIGLWVGEGSTPNRVAQAAAALAQNRDSTPAQLQECPCCHERLKWSVPPPEDRVIVQCQSADCEIAGALRALPVWTVDDDVYRERPSLLIATADKYAQIVRNAQTGTLFGLGAEPSPPPELIIQDELHLISGPLGTMAGIYEIAIDALCAGAGPRPKVIGSTATIRRAREQIRALFDRDAFQFPPPGIDHDNSGFAVADTRAPGRLYLGVTTAGRSAKFTLQAVAASFLQSSPGSKEPAKAVDPYWTLVIYYNSLRELGGSLVLMQDDVVKSIEEYARRGDAETPRAAPEVAELNSRIPSSAIPDILTRLKRKAGDASAIDVVLASNMISVGMDVPRLGLMVVNGQPKGIAEYIQATSRVGRGTTAGLVLTIYNASKARDRSHFETFATWHQSLYRDVEATSVTPYAARARDRALHAPMVAFARHLIPGLDGEPVSVRGHEEDIEAFIDAVVARADRADRRETAGVRRYLERRLDQWRSRGAISYWDDSKPAQSLLISAEAAATKRAGGRTPGAAWPTPNSMRSVEAAAEYVLMRDLEGDTE